MSTATKWTVAFWVVYLAALILLNEKYGWFA